MCNLAIYGSVPPSVSSASAIIIARGATGNLQLALDLTVSQRLGRYFVIVKRLDGRKSMLHIIKRCQTAWTMKWRKPLKSWANLLLSAFALRQAAFASSETIVPEINSI